MAPSATVQERAAELSTALEKLTEVNQQLELHNWFIGRETCGRYLSNAVVSSLLGGGAFMGSLVKLSFKGGEIHSDTLVSSWSNIRIQLTNLDGEPIPGHLYGKVIRQFSEGPRGFAVHFTSMAPEVIAFFQSLSAVHGVS